MFAHWPQSPRRHTVALPWECGGSTPLRPNSSLSNARQDPQNEFALLRESHTILEQENAARVLGEVVFGSLDMLFPGFTDDTQEQATLSAGQSGHGRTLIVGPLITDVGRAW